MDTFKKGYFTEECPLWPGRALSVRVLEKILDRQTDFQHLEIFRGEGFGLMLALDGKIQLAEQDEFIYHEMFAHVTAFAHPEPENALIVGGGDGGLVRELLKHNSIENIDVCELDEQVVEDCSRYFSWTKKAMNDSRVRIFYEDGAKFVKARPNTYDIILVDGPDPIGPGEVLFGESFLADCKHALKPDGVLSAQSESYLLHPDVTSKQCRAFKKLFQYSGYSFFAIPSYPGGSLGICTGCDEREVNIPARMPFIGHRSGTLKMYSPAMHRASFVLPPFWTGTEEN